MYILYHSITVKFVTKKHTKHKFIIYMFSLYKMKVFEYLVKHEHVNPSKKQSINIMSQYNAQVASIRKALLDKKYININVNTVVASQGT